MERKLAGFVAMTVAAAMLGGSSAAADAVADFYKDKTITVVSAGGAGGAHGAYAQLISTQIGKYIPGKPNVIVQYMPGAGGNKAMNYLFRTRPDDGTFLGVPLQDLIFNARIGVKAVKYDPARALYLGGVDSTRTTVTVMRASGAVTLDDAKRKEVLMGSSGKSGQTYIIPTVLNHLLGTRFRVVSGYRGLGLMHLAMAKGEIHGRAASYQSIAGTKQEWVEKKLIANLVTIAGDRDPDVPEAPALTELVSSAEDKALVRLLSDSAALGRAWIAFGGIPQDRLAALRAAYGKTLADPKFGIETAKRKLPVRPVSWQVQQKLVADLLATPDSTVRRLKSILKLK